MEISSGMVTLVNFNGSKYRIKGTPYNVHRDGSSGELTFSIRYGGRQKKTAYVAFGLVREYLEDRLGTTGPDLSEVLDMIP